MATLRTILADAKLWDSMPIADRKAVIGNLMLRDKKNVPLKLWAQLTDAQRTAIYRVDWHAAINPIHCDQCQAARINGVFCHETGCPNQKKTWLAERREWIRFVACFECGFDVEEGTYCGCCEETGAEPEQETN
jgi:hypothetical protein